VDDWSPWYFRVPELKYAELTYAFFMNLNIEEKS
jgi:hypothetical protein